MTFCILITGTDQVDGTLPTLSQDGSSVMSFDELPMPELSCSNHATVQSEALLSMDTRCQMVCVEQPAYSASLRLHSPFYDPHVAFTTRLSSPAASSSPLPYFAAMPPAAYHLNCDERHAESISSRLVSESTPSFTLPVPSDAVLVRPRMPVMTDKRETPLVTPPSLLLLSSPTHAADAVDGNSQETGSNAATVYGGGFHAPPTNTSTATHGEELAATATATASFSCCPHCGVGFVATAVPRNIIYHPTGPSYVLHYTPTLQPCYPVSVSGVVAQPAAAAAYAAASAQTPVRLPDASHQQTCTRLPMPPHQASVSPSFASASPSVNAVRVRTARPPLSCANCGRIGHSQLDCKEQTIDTVLNTRTYYFFYITRQYATVKPP